MANIDNLTFKIKLDGVDLMRAKLEELGAAFDKAGRALGEAFESAASKTYTVSGLKPMEPITLTGHWDSGLDDFSAESGLYENCAFESFASENCDMMEPVVAPVPTLPHRRAIDLKGEVIR